MSVRRLGVAAGLAAAVAMATAAPVRAVSDARCAAGSFCAWSGANYAGKVARLNLETATPNRCVALPDKLVAKSLANLMTRDVGVYEVATCSTEAEFTTYPKGGTFVPNAPFVVRAIQVWE
jgi:lauroyl/myristoyl acyltransferase